MKEEEIAALPNKIFLNKKKERRKINP